MVQTLVLLMPKVMVDKIDWMVIASKVQGFTVTNAISWGFSEAIAMESCCYLLISPHQWKYTMR